MKGDSNKAERQLHLNHAYDSFMDLAELLGVPPKAMSLNGMLGLAIGAQGGGNAAAHFVPGVNEINLTRTSGAGSLAHEWGHALDHYFATQAGLARNTEPFLTEHVGTVDAEGYIKRAGRKEKAFGDVLRPEIAGAFKTIVEAMNIKLESAEQVKARLMAARSKAGRNVDGWLKAIKRDFMAQQVDEQKFDALAERIRNLETGEGDGSISGNSIIWPTVSDLRSIAATQKIDPGVCLRPEFRPRSASGTRRYSAGYSRESMCRITKRATCAATAGMSTSPST
jgi:hypothetical protein